ncbi:MAG: hypothetical protein DRO40_00525 [Thermoprotei archaeon]|nr:MAG: hypothetical protein DRO40_00525 [Thermoprotei archaeon]
MSEEKLPTKHHEEEEEVRTLREVFAAISGFLRDIREPLKDLINILVDALNGEKLGKEVAAFYNALIKDGVPEELAKEMTREFFKKKLESAPSVGKMLSSFTGMMRKPKIIVKKEEEKEHKEDVNQ